MKGLLQFRSTSFSHVKHTFSLIVPVVGTNVLPLPDPVLLSSVHPFVHDSVRHSSRAIIESVVPQHLCEINDIPCE